MHVCKKHHVFNAQIGNFSKAPPLEVVKVKHTKLQRVWASLNVNVCKKHHIFECSN